MSAMMVEGFTDPLDPFAFRVELLGQEIRCWCSCECPPHVPEPAALVVFGAGMVAIALASYAAGRLAKIRRRIR